MLNLPPIGSGCCVPQGGGVEAAPIQDLRVGEYSVGCLRSTPYSCELACLSDEELVAAITPVLCHALRCNPVESIVLSYLHFRDLAAIQAIAIQAAASGIVGGKSQYGLRDLGAHGHWSLTVWGQIRASMASSSDVFYGGRFGG